MLRILLIFSIIVQHVYQVCCHFLSFTLSHLKSSTSSVILHPGIEAIREDVFCFVKIHENN